MTAPEATEAVAREIRFSDLQPGDRFYLRGEEERYGLLIAGKLYSGGLTGQADSHLTMWHGWERWPESMSRLSMYPESIVLLACVEPRDG